MIQVLRPPPSFDEMVVVLLKIAVRNGLRPGSIWRSKVRPATGLDRNGRPCGPRKTPVAVG
jgi:hypothetical protein